MTGTGDGLRAAKETWTRQHWGVRWSTIAGVLGAIVLGGNALSATEKLGKWTPVFDSTMRAYVDEKYEAVVAMQQKQYDGLQLQQLNNAIQNMNFQMSQLLASQIQVEQALRDQPGNPIIQRAKTNLDTQIKAIDRAKTQACEEIRRIQGWAIC